jgi:hypothetical protein
MAVPLVSSAVVLELADYCPERSSGFGVDIMVDHHGCIAGPLVTVMRASPASLQGVRQTRQAPRTR